MAEISPQRCCLKYTWLVLYKASLTDMWHVAAEGESGDNPTLGAGRVMYPFVFNLPANLPSSFEGEWGRVRYSLQATIDKPWKFDHHCKRAFTVLSVLDLNVQPNVMVRKCENTYSFYEHQWTWVKYWFKPVWCEIKNLTYTLLEWWVKDWSCVWWAAACKLHGCRYAHVSLATTQNDIKIFPSPRR